MRNIATKNKIKQMKRNINLLLLSLLILVGCGAKAQDKNQTVMANNKKVLVAYFSYSGTTKATQRKSPDTQVQIFSKFKQLSLTPKTMSIGPRMTRA